MEDETTKAVKREVIKVKVGTQVMWVDAKEWETQQRYFKMLDQIMGIRMFYGGISDEQERQIYNDYGFAWKAKDLSPRGDTYFIITNRGIMRKSRVDGSVYELDSNYEPLLTPTTDYVYIRDARSMDL